MAAGPEWRELASRAAPCLGDLDQDVESPPSRAVEGRAAYTSCLTSQRRLTRPVSRLVSSCPREHQASRLGWAAGTAEVRHRLAVDIHSKAADMVAVVEETDSHLEEPAAMEPAAMVQAAMLLEAIHGRIMLAWAKAVEGGSEAKADGIPQAETLRLVAGPEAVTAMTTGMTSQQRGRVAT